MQRKCISAAILVAAAAAACASAGAGAASDGSYNEITAAQIAQLPSSVSDAWEVVQRLEQSWTDPTRGGGSRGYSALPIVYRNGSRYGGIRSLRTIPRRAIESIQWITPREATTRWGTGHMSGVIMVITG